jgi:hypothetical protein
VYVAAWKSRQSHHLPGRGSHSSRRPRLFQHSGLFVLSRRCRSHGDEGRRWLRRLVEISDHLPIKIEFIETRDKVEELLGKLEELAGSGLIETQETTVAKPAQVSKSAKPLTPAHLKIQGKAQMMRIYLSEHDRWSGKPLYGALVEAMRANDIAGVTVYRGILGYGAHRRNRKDNPLLSPHHGSVMLSAIDTAEKLRAFLPIVDKMVAEGLVVFSDVDVIKYAYRALDADQETASATQDSGQGQVQQ